MDKKSVRFIGGFIVNKNKSFTEMPFLIFKDVYVFYLMFHAKYSEPR